MSKKKHSYINTNTNTNTFLVSRIEVGLYQFVTWKPYKLNSFRKLDI